MATLVAGSQALDLLNFDITSLTAGTVTVATGAQYSTSDSGITDNLYGRFLYGLDGTLSAGNIQHVQETVFGQMAFDLSGFDLPVTTFLDWVAHGENLVAKQTVFAGDDSIQGSVFADYLIGYGGADTISAGAGADTIDGGDGASYLRGDDGNDSIAGGAQFDDINGNMGNDTIHAGAGSDWAVGGKDNDLIYGDAGDDIVYGNLGNDTLSGNEGNDTVRGGQGDDSLLGQDGNDWLSGDRGNDTLAGGPGADIFHTFSGAGLDRVLDFHVSEGDRVQIDAGSPYTVSQVGADTVIDLGGGDSLVLVGVDMTTLPPGAIFVA